ncbi:MAG: hypothetical protein H6708_31465 [Kofleriaceae bacterium]|nr:hypothetical protein [Kofleriaceae bacterium]
MVEAGDAVDQRDDVEALPAQAARSVPGAGALAHGSSGAAARQCSHGPRVGGVVAPAGVGLGSAAATARAASTTAATTTTAGAGRCTSPDDATRAPAARQSPPRDPTRILAKP